MGVGNLAYICQQLIIHGRYSKTPVAIIEWGTTEKQRTLIGDLETINDLVAKEHIQNPAMVLVGEVIHLREKVKWYEKVLEAKIVTS